MLSTDWLYLIAGASTGAALMSGVGAIAIVYDKRGRLRREYEREFGQEPPEYFSSSDIRRQLEIKRSFLNP